MFACACAAAAARERCCASDAHTPCPTPPGPVAGQSAVLRSATESASRSRSPSRSAAVHDRDAGHTTTPRLSASARVSSHPRYKATATSASSTSSSRWSASARCTANSAPRSSCESSSDDATSGSILGRSAYTLPAAGYASGAHGVLATSSGGSDAQSSSCSSRGSWPPNALRSIEAPAPRAARICPAKSSIGSTRPRYFPRASSRMRIIVSRIAIMLLTTDAIWPTTIQLAGSRPKKARVGGAAGPEPRTISTPTAATYARALLLIASLPSAPAGPASGRSAPGGRHAPSPPAAGS